MHQCKLSSLCQNSGSPHLDLGSFCPGDSLFGGGGGGGGSVCLDFLLYAHSLFSLSEYDPVTRKA